MVRVVRGLGQAVRIDQLDRGLRREPALHQLLLQRLARDRHVAQVRQRTGVLLQIGHEDFKVGRHDLNDVDPGVDDLLDEALRVQDHLLFDKQRPPADEERGNQLPQRDVEALRRRLGHHVPLADPEIVDLGEEVVE